MQLKKIDRLFYQALGEELHNIRKKRGYSLRYLSELTGLSRTTLDRIELGIIRVKDENYNIICDSLGISPMINVEVKIGLED